MAIKKLLPSLLFVGALLLSNSAQAFTITGKSILAYNVFSLDEGNQPIELLGTVKFGNTTDFPDVEAGTRIGLGKGMISKIVATAEVDPDAAYTLRDNTQLVDSEGIIISVIIPRGKRFGARRNPGDFELDMVTFAELLAND